MSTHCQILLAEKLYSLLKDSASLMALVDGVYESIPDDVEFPFVRIGPYDWDDNSNQTGDGFRGSVQVSTWDQSRGQNVTMTIQNIIYDLLHKTNLGISGFDTIVCNYQSGRIILEPDGRTYQGIMLFSVVLGGQ